MKHVWDAVAVVIIMWLLINAFVGLIAPYTPWLILAVIASLVLKRIIKHYHHW